MVLLHIEFNTEEYFTPQEVASIIMLITSLAFFTEEDAGN